MKKWISFLFVLIVISYVWISVGKVFGLNISVGLGVLVVVLTVAFNKNKVRC